MTTAKQTPESELPRAIAEAKGWKIISRLVGYMWEDKDGSPTYRYDKWENLIKDDYLFHELTGNPETHAKICSVLHSWFTLWGPADELARDSEIETIWWQNPTYLTENGGWRAWWLRAYLEILLNETAVVMRPKKLEYRDVAGAGKQIYADTQYKTDCAEFTMKEGFQMIATEPWIQFPTKGWNEMMEQTFKEMVDLWNAKYGV